MLAMIRATIVDQEKFRWLPPSLITDFHQGRHRMFACREKITSYYLSAPSVATNYELKNYELKNKMGEKNPSVASPDRSFIAAEKFPDLFCALSPTATRPFKKEKEKRSVFMK